MAGPYARTGRHLELERQRLGTPTLAHSAPRPHFALVLAVLKTCLLLFALLFLLPLGIAAARYRWNGSGGEWRTADRSSAGLLPANPGRPAALRVFAAQTVRWRGIFATHCWIVFKPEGDTAYTRYDYTAWGDPIRVNGFVADGRWFGRTPLLVFAADGTLFVTLGERSDLPGRVQAQDLGSHFGKIVRINRDGTVPQDNPFVGRADARPEIWSLGHRNVLSAAFDPQGRLWEVEMGPKGGDELNRP